MTFSKSLLERIEARIHQTHEKTARVTIERGQGKMFWRSVVDAIWILNGKIFIPIHVIPTA